MIGIAIFISVHNVGAVRCTVLTVLIPQRFQWLRVRLMDAVGKGQKYCNEIIGKVHVIGNNLGLPEPALKDTLEGLEEDVEEDTGVKVRFPVDEKAQRFCSLRLLQIFFAEPHIDGLIGYAKVSTRQEFPGH